MYLTINNYQSIYQLSAIYLFLFFIMSSPFVQSAIGSNKKIQNSKTLKQYLALADMKSPPKPNEYPLTDYQYDKPIQQIQNQVRQIESTILLKQIMKDLDIKIEKLEKLDIKPQQSSKRKQTEERKQKLQYIYKLVQRYKDFIKLSYKFNNEDLYRLYERLYEIKDFRLKKENKRMKLDQITKSLKQLNRIKTKITKKTTFQYIKIKKNQQDKKKQENQQDQKKLDKKRRERLLELHILDQSVDDQIQQVKQQFITPWRLRQFIQNKQDDMFRQVSFYLVAAWIISFLLAGRDKSRCITQPIINDNFTFKIWLWTDGGITSLAAILLFITVTCCSKAFHQFNIILKIISVLVIFLKFGWVIFGIWIFLTKVNYLQGKDWCSDDVITYCSLEFVIFFIFVVYVFVKIIQSVAQRIVRKITKLPQYTKLNFPKDPEQDKLKYSVQINYDPSQHDFHCNRNGLQEAKCYFGMNKSDFENLCQRFMSWTMLGWVYGLVLWKQDTSQCLDITQISLRTWLIVDGFTSLAFFIFLIVLMIVKIFYNYQMIIFYWQKHEAFQFEIQFFTRNCGTAILGVLLVLQVLFKFAWMIVGVVLFCFFLKDCYISNTASNFLVFYFTQAIYVVYETMASLIRGRLKKSQLKDIYTGKQQNNNIFSNNNLSNSNKQLFQRQKI